MQNTRIHDVIFSHTQEMLPAMKCQMKALSAHNLKHDMSAQPVARL